MIKVIKKINNDMAKDGMIKTINNILNNCNTEVIVKSNKKIDKILSQASGIIVSNHPSEADVLAILSAMKNRNDIFLIINSNLTKIIPELDKNLIPVYINNSIKSLDGKIKLWFLSLVHKFEKYSKEEEHKKNIESIKLAIKKINQGGLVIIFPDGGNGKMNWFNGIGLLINGLKNKKNKYLIRAKIQGTSNLDYLRLFPFVGKILPKFRVYFSKPVRLDLFDKNHPKTTTINLEKKYWQWVSSCHLWTRLSKDHLWLRTLFLILVTKPSI